MDHFGRPLIPPPASGQHFGAQPAEGYQGSSAHDSDQFALSTAYDKVQHIMLNPYNIHRVSEKDLDDFRFILQMIMQECSRTNIESGKTWIFKNCHDVQEMEAIADFWLALSQSRTSFSERLHLIYLVNDVLFHSDRRQLGWMKDAILPRLVPLLRQAYHLTGITTDKQKVIKVISIWSDKHFFDPAVIDNIKESVLIPPPPPAPVTPYDVRPSPPPSSHPPMAPMVPMPPPHFNPGFRLPYPPPPAPSGYYPRPHVRPPPPIPPPGMHPHAPQPPPTPPKPPVYASRPPPPVVAVNPTHFPSATVDHNPAQPEPVIEKPYYELPAGLMIRAIQQASAAYVAIHPSQGWI
ncbi:hypothetical protein BJV82DRAFT_9505 [Fennellomyces sp. T-0311]|nr:hypothetical protein BJV82DRAFT_9505 [Fennellomyces sp. T-0311]